MSAIELKEFGYLEDQALCGAAALQRALEQVIGTMQKPIAFLKVTGIGDVLLISSSPRRIGTCAIPTNGAGDLQIWTG
ncbi:MAG: hypothetical protein ABI137_01985 [Antricoccus sp.]